MELILKIAWRNILRHKTKSLVIGIILFFGALIMTIGNGIIVGMDQGLHDNIVNGFLGDAVIVSDKQQTDNLLFEMYGRPVEEINNYKDIKAVLQTIPFIEYYLPAGKNMAMVLNDDEDGTPDFKYLLGVDFAEYQKMFPDNITTIEGTLLKPGEIGMLMPAWGREEYYNASNIWILPENGAVIQGNLTKEAMKDKDTLRTKENIVFMGYNNDNTTSDIRLGVKGIIKYKALNTFWGHFILTDIESYRECMGYFNASDKLVEIPKDKKALLESENLDDMFNTDSMMVSDTGTLDEGHLTITKKEEAPIDIEAGTYNMIMMRFKKGTDQKKAIAEITRLLQEKDLKVRVISWQKATGVLGSMAVLIKAVLFGFVMFLFFVAIIIIVNTLSMAALERTSEIGMMRAVGAQKGFIRNMFIGETAMLSAMFGGLGIVIGIIAVTVLPGMHITTQNDFLQLMYGGDTMNPQLAPFDIVITILQLAMVTLIAVIYPVKVAQSITPLDAISRE